MKNLSLSALMLAGILVFSSCSKDDGGGGTSGPSVASLACASATVNGQAIAGIALTNVSATIQYTGGNGLAYTVATIPSTGVTGLTAALVPGTLANGNGSLTYLITGTPSAAGTASFAISFGGQSCSLSLTVIAQPNLPYSGKWMYQYIRDTVYNWAELVYNNNWQVDSVLAPVDTRTSGGYFQFNNNYTYTWLTSGGTTYSGSYSTATNNYGYGVTLKCLGISTSAPPNDTTRIYIYSLAAPNMTLNRTLAALNGNNDTIVIDRFYDLLKQ